MSEEAVAVQEVAKAASNAIDKAGDFGGFISRYVSGPIAASTGMLQDHLEYVRWERRQRLMKRAETFAAQSGLSDNRTPLPLNVAIPLLKAASLEEDDYLQDEWAKLLVNSVDEREGHTFQKSFVRILQELTVADAKILRAIVEAPVEVTNGGFVATSLLPYGYASAKRPNGTGDRPAPPKDVAISLYNLLRLGLVDRSSFNPIKFDVAYPTVLGRAFIKACTIRAASEEPSKEGAGFE